MKKILITLAILFCWVQTNIGQQLRVGDKVPDFTIENVINYDAPSFKISDFEGKLVILDFWNHGCKACIRAFPKIDSLQKEFSDQLQFIMVNNEDKEKSEKWIAKRSNFRIPDVPMVTGGGKLSKAFPQNFYPWHVWIDENRIVRFITGGSNASRKNIQKFLEGEELDFSQLSYISKSDSLYTTTREDYENTVKSAEYYSYLAKYDFIKGPKNNWTRNRQNGKIRISRESGSIASFFRDAFFTPQEIDRFPKNAYVLNVEDEFKYRPPEDKSLLDQWISKNMYSYDLAIPESRAEDLNSFMQQDLMRYFNVEASREKRLIDCYVLVNTGDIQKLRSSEEMPSVDSLFIQGTSDKKLPSDYRYMQNMPFERFADRIAYWVRSTSGIAVVNEVEFNGNITIKFSAELIDSILPKVKNSLDLEKLRKELRSYGLDIVKEERMIDCLVISEI
ncbi:TlpA family protein disulfide reductase [Echinicola marina]|uniref:TlpA family protein disulfide reductase n=1 Tax=Echinicola marina TaxID=2859768 RepID=UPI001CF70A12|nr:TlpA disulfide reductase family protein [Echinicola marina]UCS94332.1 TlpA family protein disulfide reductase [Echinicola marina]